MIGTLALKADHLHRERCIKNLRHIFPDRSASWRAEVLKGVFQHGVACSYEFLRLSLVPNNARALFDIENMEILRRAVQANHGVIGLTAHFGNPSIVPFVLYEQLPNYSIIVRESNSKGKSIANKYRRLRERLLATRAHIRPLRSGLAGIREAKRQLLRQGHVTVLADVTWGAATVPVLMFGRTIEVSRAPAWLARQTGSILLPFFTYRKPTGTHVLRFHEPLLWDSPLPNGISDRIVMQHYANILQRYVEQWPDQWLWTYSRG
jgi:KDO2-lipid IV(A) lauroyltransferase